MGRPRPPFPPGAAAPPHLVELPLARLDQERPGAAPRSYVGDRRCCRARPGASRARALPKLGAALRPRPARHGIHDLTEGRAAARAIDSLRRGWPVAVDGVGMLAVETAEAETLAAFDGDGAPAALLISGPRAATLRITNQREAVPTQPVLIRRMPWLDLDIARAVADPALDLASPLKGPFQTQPLCSPPTAEAALR